MGIGYGCLFQIIGVLAFFGLHDTSELWAWLALAVFGIGGTIYGFALNATMNDELRVEILKKMDKVNREDFTISKFIVANDFESKIAIDEENKKVCIWINKTPNAAKLTSNSNYDFTTKIFDFTDILSVEVIKDGVSITNTSRRSQLGGALVGGALAGGVGAVIGGLSGKQTTTEETTSINLAITVNDLENPYYLINFYAGKSIELQTTHPTDAMNDCKTWFGILSFVIKEMDKKDEPITEVEDDKTETTDIPKKSLADELIELNKLKEMGILTDEEFEQQKAKVLNR